MGKEIKTETKKQCFNCKHWKNQQMLLNYSEFTGFCINPSFAFNTTDGRLIGVVDTESLRDRSKVTGNCANDFEVMEKHGRGVKESQYLLQTEELFGCNFHETK